MGFTVVSMEAAFNLDEQAQLALDVAKHAALANGDNHCGTEYLLYGLVATARGELVELTDLFALNVLRIDRAIEGILQERATAGTLERGAPMLSMRARRALSTPRLDGSGPTGPFEVLHGLLEDDESGACRVLRTLGVQPDEARQLVGYGLRHLSKEQVDELISTLDRRSNSHQPWWGPVPGGRIRSLAVNGQRSIRLASSDSALVEVTALGADHHGFGFTLSARSLRTWVLPPLFSPTERLVPGQGARYADGPDFVMLQILLPDGQVLDNRHNYERFAGSTPTIPRLVRLGQRDERLALNDRRQHDQHTVTTDWWAWPLPGEGSIEMRIDWPAEAISGVISFESAALRQLVGPPPG